MSQATPSGITSLGDVVDAVVARLMADETLSEQTRFRIAALIRQFAAYVQRGHGVVSLGDVTPAVVETYLCAATSTGLAPSVSLQHFRRSAVRVLFRRSRELGLDVRDPSIDVGLPTRSAAGFRPLDDDEIDVARAAAVAGQRDRRAAAAWALCEATARTGELPWLEWDHVDLAGARVWIPGTPRTLPRWAYLTDWGRVQVARHHRLAAPASPADRIFHSGRPGSALAQSTAVGTISRILTAAGLDASDGVRPSSVAAWAGFKIFEQTQRIEIVAPSLGLRSLDRAARFIGWDWSHSG